MASSNSKQQAIVTSVGVGLRLLPFFMQSIETLFGKQTGQTKKQAVHDLFNAAAVGAATGFGLAGGPATADLINGFRPIISATIDELAAQMFPTHTVVPAVDAATDAAANSVG